MSRITDTFKNNKAFIGFITAGDPCIEKTEEYILTMLDAGADLIEIGIPFSDPIAEGPVIQEADLRSLSAGTTTDTVFELVARLRDKTDKPLVFMTYLNPVFSYGYDKFFKKGAECGLDGIIIPDMPFEEKHEVEDVAKKYQIEVISLIAPTSEDRISTIAAEAKGFIYLVSSLGVTGVRTNITTDIESIVKVIRKATDIPVAVGFGISTPEQAADMAAKSDGAIVGSAIVRIIAKYGDNAKQYIYDYVKSMSDAVHALHK